MQEFWTAPPLYKGETVVCIGTGPSLRREDVDYCQGRARVIAVNDAYTWAPWADVLYGCDAKWWGWHGGCAGFQGLKVSLEATEYDDVKRLRHSGQEGYDPNPDALRCGRNSGYQAIHLAVHFGSPRILLLGFDMQVREGKVHFFGQHPVPTKDTVFRDAMLPRFPSLKVDLDKLGVEVVNCTPGSALTIWPMSEIRREI